MTSNMTSIRTNTGIHLKISPFALEMDPPRLPFKEPTKTLPLQFSLSNVKLLPA